MKLLLNRMRSRARAFSSKQFFTLLWGVILCSAPVLAQQEVDPTTGAQSVAKFLVDGLLYIVAAASVICFFWGIFTLFRRPLEGILEIAIGLTVFYLVGHSLGWASGLTGVQVGLLVWPNGLTVIQVS